MAAENTAEQLRHVTALCRDIFEKKLKDYGASWRIMRSESITDQIFIKATRIRTLETKGDAKVDEGILPEFIGIVNYGIIGQIQLAEGYVEAVDMTADQALEQYDSYMEQTLDLLAAKNHDYDEAWRKMRIGSYTDFILMKLLRTKQIEDNKGVTLISEGIDANYKDMINYSLFALIKLEYE